MSKIRNKKQKVNEKDQEFDGDVDLFKEITKSQCEDLVLNQFPIRVQELQDLLETNMFCLKNVLDFQTEINISIPSIPVPSDTHENDVEWDVNKRSSYAFLFPNGLVKSNLHLLDLIEILKPKALQLIKDVNSVKMGIELMIPKIEDGNNFGVEIQHEVLLGVMVVELKVQRKMDLISNYFTKRAEIVTKVAKYPHSYDYRRAVEECDQKFAHIFCLFAMDLRNHYIGLHDLFQKNYIKIKEPRNSSNDNMMY